MSGVEPAPAHLRGAVDLSSLAAPRSQGGPSDAGGAAAQVASLVADATDQSFNDYLELSARVPVLVHLWSAGRPETKELAPLLARLTQEYGGRLVLVNIDVDANPQLAGAFQAQSVPLVAAVIGGRPLQLFTGLLPEQQLRQLLEQVLQAAAQSGVTGTAVAAEQGEPQGEGAEPEPEPLPPLHAEAYEAIEQGDYARAISAYTTAIAQNPTDKLAVAGLAQVKLLHRLQGKTLDEIRSRAAEHPDDLDAALDVSDLDVSGGHVEDAFDRLLGFFASASAEDRNRIRERLVEYFEVVGTDDPRVVKARARLTNLLY
ncbi:tetratricopeptide repeat protein [Okibacterium endophyticum]